MKIQMTGIDHSAAQVELRERFAFTKTAQRELMRTVLATPDVCGCVMISTCNRTELYVSAKSDRLPDLCGAVCGAKQIDSGTYRNLFADRRGKRAVSHLFAMAAGIRSRILGEDQILTQIGAAAEWARECGTIDNVLEVLFRMAVTAGKKARTQIGFTHGNRSAVDAAVEHLRRKGYPFAGQNCLVIGNGEIGRLAAQAFREAGCAVTVTVREYRSGYVHIPEGCDRIFYGDRYEKIPACSYVVSATVSPNLTLERERLEAVLIRKGTVFLDLAVPRDIDPSVGELPGVLLYDIDDFGIARLSPEQEEQLKETELLLEQSVEEFCAWYAGRDFVPLIRDIGKKAADDVCWRMGRYYPAFALTDEARGELDRYLGQTSAKVVQRLLFRLRDSVSTEVLSECLRAFAAAYEEE